MARQVDGGDQAGGLAGVARRIGWAVFAVLTGGEFAEARIPSSLKISVGAGVVGLPIGTTLGALLDPSWFRRGLSFAERVGAGAALGLAIGLVVGLILVLLTSIGDTPKKEKEKER